MASTDFIHLHTHSEFSALDGMPKVEDYVIRASELGFQGLALTEHGNMRSVVQLFNLSKGNFTYGGNKYDLKPIKPIVGIEFYLSPINHLIKGVDEGLKADLKRKCATTSEYKEKLKELEAKMMVRKRYHMLAFAKNSIGYENLLMLNYLSWKDGYYYRPRIDMELLEQYKEGIIVTTSCIGGAVPNLLLNKKEDEAFLFLKRLKEMFKDDVYVEIQPHNIEEQRIANLSIIPLAEELKIKIVATNDCHYLRKDDYKAHNVLLAIQSRKPLQSSDAWRFDDNAFYMKDKQEMYDSFALNHPNIPKEMIRVALGNTMEIYEKCNIGLSIDKKQGILPNVEIPSKKNPKNYLIELCKTGWKWRDIKKISSDYAKSIGITEEESIAIYKDRLKLELERIFKLKFEKYFLIIHELIWWARDNDIMVGPGRGSSSGSLVCYLLGITSIDPIKYDLLFDRFLNETRMDYPDIDMDFEDARRKEIFKHLFDKYGYDHASLVGTFGRMKGKQALQDIGRVLEIPFRETSAITKHIIVRSGGDARVNQSVEDSFKEFEVCKQYDKKYPDVLGFVKVLEGKVRQVGIHACGIQLAPMQIEKLIPIEFREIKDKDEIELWGTNRLKVAALDWRDSQDMGLVKIDVLGLKTLTILKQALVMIEKRHNIKIDLEKIDLEDKSILDGFTANDFVGIFQFDSIGMMKMCDGLKFTHFEDVITMNALYRPGGMRSGLFRHFIDRKIGKEKIEKLHPIYDEITKSTLGVLVYQEQLMKCFVNLAGFSPYDADVIRKAVAKSQGVEFMQKRMETFVNGAVKNGMDAKTASQLFENISFFGSYAFNKAHAAAYASISYWCMYLKVNYPTEFYYALMDNEADMSQILHYVSSSRKAGVDVEIADINYSKTKFTIKSNKAIISGLSNIKGCGEKASNSIVDNQPYNSMKNFIEKVNRRLVHKGVIQALIKAGAFRSLYPNIGALLFEIEYGNKKVKKTGDTIVKPVWEWMIELSEEDGNILYSSIDKKIGKMSEEQEVKIMSQVCPIPPYKHKIEYYDSILKYIMKDRDNIDEMVQPNEVFDFTAEFSEDGLKRNKAIFVGTLADIKYNSVGDFHKTQPDEIEKKRIGWGQRYSSVNVENSYSMVRISVDYTIFPTYRHIIDKGLGTPVLVIATLVKWKDIAIADMIIDLDNFRDIMQKKLPIKERYALLNPQEKYLLKHPTRFHNGDMKTKLSDLKHEVKLGTKRIIALVTRVKNHWTKKNKKMMFIELEDNTGYCSAIAWPECVTKNHRKLKTGMVLKLYIKKSKDGYFIDDNKEITVVEEVWKQVGENV